MLKAGFRIVEIYRMDMEQAGEKWVRSVWNVAVVQVGKSLDLTYQGQELLEGRADHVLCRRRSQSHHIPVESSLPSGDSALLSAWPPRIS